MLMKIGGLARALYAILAILAAFVAFSMMNVPLVLVVLGLVAGVRCSKTRWSLQQSWSWGCRWWALPSATYRLSALS
jgi:hypothetical protein